MKVRGSNSHDIYVVDIVTEVVLTGSVLSAPLSRGIGGTRIVCFYSWSLFHIWLNSFVFIVIFWLYFDFFENDIKNLVFGVDYLSELQLSRFYLDR